VNTAIVAGLFALGGGIVTATLQNWLTGRSAVAGDLRTERAAVYTDLWRLTGAVSRWPRTDLTAADVGTLHRRYRAWYYDTAGGLYLSAGARARYGEMQELFGTMAGAGATDPLDDETYHLLMESASALRTALTDDLSTRDQASLLAYLSRRRVQRSAGRAAVARHAALDRQAQTRSLVSSAPQIALARTESGTLALPPPAPPVSPGGPAEAAAPGDA
jgi:DNA-binding phage protein